MVYRGSSYLPHLPSFSTMHILVDENIPYGVEVFTTLGTVQSFHGRHLSTTDLATTDVLIVRSITPVNQKLLAGTPVSFVGTATIGTDHVDLAYLQQRDIGFIYNSGTLALRARRAVMPLPQRNMSSVL